MLNELGRALAPWLLPADAEIGWGVSISQSIFTSRKRLVANPRREDHPFAGHLSGAFTLSAAASRWTSDRRACGPKCPDSGSSGRLKVSPGTCSPGSKAAPSVYQETLDGNRNGYRQIDREPLVADLSIGLVVAYERARLAFTFVSQTRTFDEQPDRMRGSTGVARNRRPARRAADPLRAACQLLGSTLSRVAQGARVSSRRLSEPPGYEPGVPPWPRFPSFS